MESDKIQNMKEKLLICSVCMDEFNDPRILPCHHSFCLECIEDIVQSLPVNARSFSCPHCRKGSAIPRQGMSKLPVNFYLVGLKEELDIADQCGMCHVCDLAHAQFNCVDCNIKICRFCIAPHRLEKHLTRSRIERLSSLMPSSHVLSDPCEIHSGEMLQLFCCTCQQAICITCSWCQDHKRHTFIPLSKKLQEIQTEMQKELNEVIHERQKACKSALFIETRKKALIDSSNESISNLNYVALKSCETIMKLKSKMEDEIKASTEIQTSKINDFESKLQAYIGMLEKGQDFLNDQQENDVCMEAVKYYKKFSFNLKEAKNLFTSTNVLLQQQTFTPLYDIRATNVNIGSLKTHLLFGNLGVLDSNQQNLFVDKKSLEVFSKPRRQFRFFSFTTMMKISLAVTSFMIFKYMISRFNKYPVVNDLGAGSVAAGLCVPSVQKTPLFFSYWLSQDSVSFFQPKH